MATVKVRQPSPTAIAVRQGVQSTAAVVVKRNAIQQISLDELIDVSTSNATDGDALIYEGASSIWVAKRITSDNLDAIDGGTY